MGEVAHDTRACGRGRGYDHMVPPAPIRISYLDNLQMHLGTAASTTVLSLGAAPTSITVLQPGLGGLFPIACMIILYTQVYSIYIYACTVVVIVQLGMSCGECLSVLIGSRPEHGHVPDPTQRIDRITVWCECE